MRNTAYIVGMEKTSGEIGGAERWQGRLNPVRIVAGKPKSEGLDDGNKGSLSFVRAAINQLYQVRLGSSQNEVQ